MSKIIYIITGVGWLILFSTFLFPTYTFSDYFFKLMIQLMLFLSPLSVATFLINLLIKNRIFSKPSSTKKIIYCVISYILILILTIATAGVSLLVLVSINLSRNPPTGQSGS